jgi:hypothetical protein
MDKKFLSNLVGPVLQAMDSEKPIVEQLLELPPQTANKAN